ncbi:MAG TPA: hypothetical protein VLZ73_12530, partial [Brevundimonas sp.]|nr:hypothetical protein [Brevundimonas sp.]
MGSLLSRYYFAQALARRGREVTPCNKTNAAFGKSVTKKTPPLCRGGVEKISREVRSGAQGFHARQD